MDTLLIELRDSLKQLTQNLLARIDSVCMKCESGDEMESLTFWLEDLSMLTETIIILSRNNFIDFEMDLFNEKADLLLDKVEERDNLFVGDLLKYDIKPLLSYLDRCITND